VQTDQVRLGSSALSVKYWRIFRQYLTKALATMKYITKRAWVARANHSIHIKRAGGRVNTLASDANGPGSTPGRGTLEDLLILPSLRGR